MDKQAILAKAESDKRVRHCLQLLRDILNISEKYNGQCFLSLDFFTQKYDISERTFYLWKKRLLECGYIKSAKKGYYISVNTELETAISCENVQHIAVESAKESETDCSLTEEYFTTTETDCSLTATSCSPIYKQKTNCKQKTKESEYLPLPFLEFGHVRLTKEQYDKLIVKFGCEAVRGLLEKIDSYVESIGKPGKYKNYYATALNWFKREKSFQASKQKSPYYDEDNPDDKI